MDGHSVHRQQCRDNISDSVGLIVEVHTTSGVLAMFISRADAERKFKISADRLRQLQKMGKLKAFDAKAVRYEQPKKGRHSGPAVKVVYDEAHVAALVGKTGSDMRFVRRQRRDAVVFDMLTEGIDVPDIVMRTRLDLQVVMQLRDDYVREKDGFVVPGKVRRLARENGITLGPHNIVEVFVLLLGYGRGIKPPKGRLARVKITPDE